MITIDEAIKLGQNHLILQKRKMHPKTAEAQELGIEALKFRLRWEQQEGEDDFPLLPGETKD